MAPKAVVFYSCFLHLHRKLARLPAHPTFSFSVLFANTLTPVSDPEPAFPAPSCSLSLYPFLPQSTLTQLGSLCSKKLSQSNHSGDRIQACELFLLLFLICVRFARAHVRVRVCMCVCVYTCVHRCVHMCVRVFVWRQRPTSSVILRALSTLFFETTLHSCNGLRERCPPQYLDF